METIVIAWHGGELAWDRISQEDQEKPDPGGVSGAGTGLGM